MESLWNEVQNLKSTMKQWEIVTLSGDTQKGVYPFDSKYADWNFIVVTGEIGGYSGDYIGSYNRNYNSITVRKPSENGRQINGNWSKSGNSIITGGTLSDGYSKSSSITVLFYK